MRNNNLKKNCEYNKYRQTNIKNEKKNVEGNGLFVKSTKPARDFTEINIGNGIKWNVNDRCNHNIFGKGTVTRVDGDIIDVTFDDFGNKKLLGSHKALSKIED